MSIGIIYLIKKVRIAWLKHIKYQQNKQKNMNS